jgi:hypothetical protein
VGKWLSIQKRVREAINNHDDWREDTIAEWAGHARDGEG